MLFPCLGAQPRNGGGCVRGFVGGRLVKCIEFLGQMCLPKQKGTANAARNRDEFKG